MKKIILLLLIASLTASCCRKAYPTKEVEKVITKTEYIEKIRIDTVEIELPQESKEIITKDTVSNLAIKGALSKAMVSGGMLHHSLQTDPTYKPKIEVQIKEVTQTIDSIVYSEKVVAVDMPRTKYEKFCIRWFWVTLSICVVFLLIKISKIWIRI